MRPRWQTALMVFTTPLWLPFALLYIGWQEAGRDYFKELPMAFRWIFKGQRP